MKFLTLALFAVIPLLVYFSQYTYLIVICYPFLSWNISFLKNRVLKNLFLVFITGCISSVVFYSSTPFDNYIFFRGIYYFIIPAFIIGFGMCLFKYAKSEESFLKTIVILLLVYTFASVTTHFMITGSFSTEEIESRSTGYVFGELSILPILCFWMLKNKEKFFPMSVIVLITCLVTLVVLISLSRTNLLQLALCVLLLFFSTREIDKMLFFIIIVTFFINFFFGEWFYENYLSNYSDVNYTSFEGKLSNSLREWVIAPRDTIAEINTEWRGFEAWMGKESIVEKGWLACLIGLGFQSLCVNFTFMDVQNGLTLIPFFHNGFITIFQKTGFVGLFFFISFLSRIFLYKSRKEKEWKYDQLTRLLIISLLVHSFLIHGMFCAHPPFFLLVMLGGLLERRYRQEQQEDLTHIQQF